MDDVDETPLQNWKGQGWSTTDKESYTLLLYEPGVNSNNIKTD